VIRPALLAAGILGLMILPFVATPYFITMMNYIGMAALAALGLVLLTGVGGLTSFGQAAFVGIAAYATAWWTTRMGGSPWTGLALGVALTGAIALLLGAATLRLGGHLLPLSTIAWGLAIFFVFGNVAGLGRHDGMSGIPPAAIGRLELRSGAAGYAMIWLTLGAMLLLCHNLLAGRQGRAIRSLRGGAAMAESLGIDTFRIRLAVFVLSALLAALSGWLYAHVQRYVSPTAFDVGPGMEYLFMAIIGGAGHIGGAVLGAAVITLAKDALQDLLPHIVKDSGPLQTVAFAGLFILVLHRARGGLIPALAARLPQRHRPVPPDGELPRRAQPQPGIELLIVTAAEKRFGGLLAVNRVDLTVRAGEILGLIGPNGAGKSTLFNLVSGALRPDAGRITFLGRDLTAQPARRIAAHGIARSFQHVRLRPTMSRLENVMLGAHLRGRKGLLAGALGLDRAEERAIAGEAMRQLRRVGLADDPHAPSGTLALGQQRILEVARALAADPLLIILDEPAAGLRRAEKQALAALLRSLSDEGLTILLVEHDMEFVMGLVDRVAVMEFGSRIAAGTPAEIRADPRVQAAYLGAAP